MSEQQPQTDRAEAGSANAASEAAIGLASEPVLAESPTIAPDQELTAPMPDAVEPKKVEKEAPKIEVPAAEVRAERTAETPRPTGKVMIMPPRHRTSDDSAQPDASTMPRRRVAAIAAVVALAAIAGAIGGALATGGFGHGRPGATAAVQNSGLETTIARIDADILALKASVEQNARLGVTQFNKTSDRLEKVEKAQGEPAARLAKLSDEVGKLRAAQAAVPAAPAQLAATPALTTVPKDVTGSVAMPATAPASPQPPGATAKVELGRLPTVDGWVLREVGRGSALIESRRGLFEVFAGDPIPGLGRVDAIRKQDGRWVVVTSKGLIVSR